MSGKLDQSLDEILSSRRQSARRGRGGRRGSTSAKATVSAPVGGIKKNTRTVRGGVRAAVINGPAAVNGDSKIIVSNLVSNATLCLGDALANTSPSQPPDVSEVQIKVCGT